MPTSQYPNAKALLDKFHAGECTPEELALLDSWYKGLHNNAPVEHAESQQERFLAGFRDYVAKKQKHNIRPLVRKWAAAASVILLAGIGYFSAKQQQLHKAKQATADNIFHVRNTSGMIKKVMLPDSSVIWMNANASLSWREEAASKTRWVAFEGEGYFEVERSSERPFVIVTRDVVVKVLGTRFNLEAYRDEKMTRVSLASGKVQVSSKANRQTQAILEPGRAAAYFPDDSVLVTHEIDTTLSTAWMDGGFTAEQLSIKDAFTRLCESNGYEVAWQNERRLQKKITIAFPKQRFGQTMDALCYMTHKNYTIKNKLVTIY
ncbi:FecR family protein [Chitinophaga horti]|uniref:FecR family protein n=1 Tax=Chitinophaga horti TaxID=2920382 RepID=A0ABY6IZ80_9BACT|nr:FecR family protein [Chitinophaga horti]UYQ91217.1 FecR family protein [Chitinophaga horti]